MKSICSPPTAYCLLPTAYCRLPTACCLLPTAYCISGRRDGEGSSQAVPDKMSPPTRKEKTSKFKKVNERGGNIYENKGPVFHSPRQSGNVKENKASYALKAGMLVKRKIDSVW